MVRTWIGRAKREWSEMGRNSKTVLLLGSKDRAVHRLPALKRCTLLVGRCLKLPAKRNQRKFEKTFEYAY
jgi:hypothetical protein